MNFFPMSPKGPCFLATILDMTLENTDDAMEEAAVKDVGGGGGVGNSDDDDSDEGKISSPPPFIAAAFIAAPSSPDSSSFACSPTFSPAHAAKNEDVASLDRVGSYRLARCRSILPYVVRAMRSMSYARLAAAVAALGTMGAFRGGGSCIVSRAFAIFSCTAAAFAALSLDADEDGEMGGTGGRCSSTMMGTRATSSRNLR
mmetsp:Transcript_35350/g.75460  ORF Transcript_35350/g.75460 Transcript_35350/m.75460 type:complete len:201 (-) Transcript_35350:418-1020(-)